MYASHIGKKFLQYYNKKHGTNYSAKEYFIKVHWPLFYDDPNYLHYSGNDPIGQLTKQKDVNNQPKQNIEIERRTALEKLTLKLDKYDSSELKFPNAGMSVSFPAESLIGTTSGQITSLYPNFRSEDLYLDWIGIAFTIGIAGGINILIDDEQVFEFLEEGFSIYREYIKETPEIKNKIETWNGIWLMHRTSKHYDSDNPRYQFNPVSFKKDNIEMTRITWIQIYFIFSDISDNEIVNAYVFSLGQMNKTIGFIQFIIKDVKRLSHLYKELYSNNESLLNKKLSMIYETERGFYVTCQSGVVGLKQLEPKDFKKFMHPGANGTYPKPKTDENSQISYYIYKLWIVAMLNNKDMLELAKESANAFRDFTKLIKRVGTAKDTIISAILEAKSKKAFVDAINDLLSSKDFKAEVFMEFDGNPSLASVLEKLVEAAMLDIATDNLPLFISLLKFEYLINNLEK